MISKNKIIFTLLLSTCIFFFASGFDVIGHRGDPIKAPEETFQSFNTAFSEGADYVELDLHVSKDNVLVVSHDRNLERVTGTSLIVSQNNFATIHQLTQKNGEPMHSLDELFAHYQNNPKAKFLIETKKTKKGNPQNMEDLLKTSIDKYGMQNRVMFHSFSTKSLKKESEIMPQIPRIFIAGTTKRVNFDVLQYVSGVNLSSNIVTPDIINALHAMNKSVYVWDEMNESPSKWNTLVNMPIDGVVTNFPATGNEYRELKENARSEAMNMNVYYFGTKDEPVYENPYRLIKTKEEVHPLGGYHITNVISSKGKEYVQLGENSFASASGFISDSAVRELRPYFGAKAIYRGENKNNYVYSDPDDPNSIKDRLEFNQAEQIIKVQKIGSQVWLQLSNGWINAKNVLIQLNPNNYLGNNSLNSYYDLPAGQRFKNIDLLEDNLYLKPSTDQHLENTKLVNEYKDINTLFPQNIVNNSINKI